jgi:beta-lactamase superfamily II metal-dependent hydrolase
MLQCVVFNVRLGQCVAFLPVNHLEYMTFIDCGHEDDFHPIDFINENVEGLLKEAGKTVLGNLTLTNYDHDHFSGLPYLRTKAKIRTTRFSKNLSSADLIELKDEITDALEEVLDIKGTYTQTAQNHNPPYVKKLFSLTKDELEAAGVPITTNHLSQIVFFTYRERTICISGDLEEPSWELMLRKSQVRELLQKTDIFFASHHGRKNGYCERVFDYCAPECVIISDKEIVHGTQESMSQKYAKHVTGDGVIFKSGLTSNKRKVISTRSDGHILINLHPNGSFEYISLQN